LVAPTFGWAGYAPKKNADEALVEMQQEYPESKFVLVRMVLEPVKEQTWAEKNINPDGSWK